MKRFHDAAEALVTLLETREAVFTLKSGDLTVKWPTHIMPAEADDVEEYLTLLLRVIRRTAEQNAALQTVPSTATDEEEP